MIQMHFLFVERLHFQDAEGGVKVFHTEEEILLLSIV